MAILFGGDITAALTDLMSQMLSFIPGFAFAIILLIVGFIVSKMVSKFIKKILEKLNIDRFGDKLNEIEIISKANFEFKLSAFFSKFIYYIILLIFIIAATEALGMQAITDMVKDIFNFIPKLFVALIFLIIGLLISDSIRAIIQTTCISLGIPSAKIIASFVFYFLFINVIISALSQTGINTDFLSQNLSLLIGGVIVAFALGYGLASKDVVANLLASFYSKDKFSIGDEITIDGETGEVIEMDKSSITLLNKDRKIIIPQSKLTSEKFIIHKNK